MNENDEPFDNTPRDEDIPVSAIGEPLPAPLATAEQGQEMQTIWKLVNMVTPTKGQLSQSLKQFWAEFMARFRHYVHPLDQSRELLVVCHISVDHLTRNHIPKDIFGLFLDERAFSVWTINPHEERGFLHFEKHPLCRAITGWGSFTMMINALPDIALTGLSDWQQAQTLIVNTHHKQFPTRTQVPFGGNVYPADLVLKTANLERELARTRKALEEKEQYANKLLEENCEHLLALEKADNHNALEVAEQEAAKAYAALAAKQTGIDQLEASMVENRKLLVANDVATSSREAALNDRTRQRLADMQLELDTVNTEKARLELETRRYRTTWDGTRTSAANLAAGGEGALRHFPQRFCS